VHQEGVAGVGFVTVGESSPEVGSPEPFIAIDFSDYQSTQEMLDHSIWGWTNPVESIKLDTTTGPPGGGTASMRYDWQVREGSCSSYTITRNIPFDENVDEVWIEMWLKYSDNFTQIAPPEYECTSARTYSWFQAQYPGAGQPGKGAGSFGLHYGPGNWGESLQIRPPNDAGVSAQFPYEVHSRIFTGEWVRIRIHIRVPSQPKSSDVSDDGSYDGLMRWWVGEELFETNFATVADAIRAVALGANLRQGPSELMHSWWGDIKMWDQDPGW